jgi:hypothetical protein
MVFFGCGRANVIDQNNVTQPSFPPLPHPHSRLVLLHLLRVRRLPVQARHHPRPRRRV